MLPWTLLLCFLHLCGGWNADMMAGAGAASFNYEVREREEGRETRNDRTTFWRSLDLLAL